MQTNFCRMMGAEIKTGTMLHYNDDMTAHAAMNYLYLAALANRTDVPVPCPLRSCRQGDVVILADASGILARYTVRRHPSGAEYVRPVR